jgi:uncharacterized protein (TIGR02996 family)
MVLIEITSILLIEGVLQGLKVRIQLTFEFSRKPLFYDKSPKEKSSPEENNVQKLFDQALYENFDDIATHSAYADWLIEQNDPRGELIRIQLALENEHLSEKERKRFQKEEKKLFSKNWAAFLGKTLLNEIAKLSKYERQQFMRTHRFARGWLVHLGIAMSEKNISKSLHADPIRFLQSLYIQDGGYDNEFKLLKDAPFLPTLKRFEVGESPQQSFIFGEDIADLLKPCKQLQYLELKAHRLKTKKLFKHSFPELLSMGIHCSTDYPLEVLAQNPSLTKLQRLAFFPHGRRFGEDESHLKIDHLKAIVESPYLKQVTHLSWNSSNIGDEGCQLLVRSGFLKQLKILDLSFGRITDEGVRLLTSSPDFQDLESIDLSENALTRQGIKELKATGINAKVSSQHTVEDDGYLYAGDME